MSEEWVGDQPLREHLDKAAIRRGWERYRANLGTRDAVESAIESAKRDRASTWINAVWNILRRYRRDQ